MKTKILSCLSAFICLLLGSAAPAFAQTTAFNYQGHLTNGTNAVNGSYDLQFIIYVDAFSSLRAAAPVTNTAVGVTNGLFTTAIDFGPFAFTGPSRYLEIGVRTNGSVSAFTILAPTQQITPTPLAIYSSYSSSAGNANTASSVSANAITGPGIQDGAVTAAKLASGQVVKSLNGLTDIVSLSAGANVTLTTNGNGLLLSASGGVTSGWALGGNTGTTSNNFLGTTDNRPLELRANGQRAMRFEPDVVTIYNSPNVIGGSPFNFVGSGSGGATIGGGGTATINGSPGVNSVTGTFGTVAGGGGNTVSAVDATVGGGVFNRASGNSATVAGGAANSATNDSATVGGGFDNHANGTYSTIPGGYGNTANGSGSFAAGVNSHVNYSGSFNWGDGTQAANSTGPNRFEVLATGGINFYPGGSNVSIATPAALAFGASTRQMVSLYDNGTYKYGIGVQNSTLYQRAGTGGGFAWYSGGSHADGLFDAGGGATLMTLNGAGTLAVHVLTIVGGSDVAEPFQMSNKEIPKGSVVVIDEENAGQLKLSSRAYDHRVAGIVSGANGINPGISLHQDGVLEGGQNVALSGRVFVLADASTSAIQPGDLLTTSSTPGHAMKVSNHAKAQGAILGKAMSSLSEGKGMVLVLVTLQ